MILKPTNAHMCMKVYYTLYTCYMFRLLVTVFWVVHYIEYISRNITEINGTSAQI
jgi:hypothetical protein